MKFTYQYTQFIYAVRIYILVHDTSNIDGLKDSCDLFSGKVQI